MRTTKAVLVVAMSLLGVVAATAPASAGTATVRDSVGDIARYDQSTNTLSICDGSPGNGTAKAILMVISGNTKEVFDTNGANAGCGSTGRLGVDDNKQAYLWACPDASGNNCSIQYGPFWL
jgi:hypothetical protein